MIKLLKGNLEKKTHKDIVKRVENVINKNRCVVITDFALTKYFNFGFSVITKKTTRIYDVRIKELHYSQKTEYTLQIDCHSYFNFFSVRNSFYIKKVLNKNE